MSANQPARINASYELAGPRPAASVDRPLLLRVRVRNTGSAGWPISGPNPVNLSYHWMDRAWNYVDFEGARAPLPQPLVPGEAAEVELLVEPPPRPGEYHLAIDMVEEGVAWFVHQGVQPLTLLMNVAEATHNAPRVCIVNGNCVINDAVGNHLVNQLRFFQRRGYEAMLLLEHIDGRHPAALRQHMMGVTLDDLRRGSDNPQTRRAVLHFQSADIYIFHYSTYYTLAEAIRLVGRGVVIFDYHGVTPPHLWQGEGVEHLIAGQRNLELVRFADYAIGHSAFTCGELIKTGQIAAERVSQMGYAVPLQRFSPGPRPAYLLERYGLAPDQPVLIYVGRMAANKRIGDLVSALALVRERLPGAALLLVGSTLHPSYARIAAETRRLAADLGIEQALIFTGQVPDEELVDHYRLASVFVTASVHEGFCIPVLEAMACGVPAIGAHATALPETIGAGGLTFEPGNVRDLADKVLALLGGVIDGGA